MQQLLTDEQLQQLKQIGLSQKENEEQVPLVKLHLPDNKSYWLFSCIVSGTERIAYGLFEMGMGFPEIGYFHLDDIDDMKFSSGVDIKNDLDFKGEFDLMKYAEIAHLNAFKKEGNQISDTPKGNNSSPPNKPQP